MSTPADTTSGRPWLRDGRPIFGVDHFCPRCGEMARQRFYFSAAMNTTQADSWQIEYCEHCKPANLIDALADMAGLPPLNTTGSPV